MNIRPFLIFAYLAGFIILYIVCRIFIRPLKWMFKLMLSCTLGCIAMLVVNKLCASFGTVFFINPMTAMTGGVLGIPGLIITFILQGLL